MGPLPSKVISNTGDMSTGVGQAVEGLTTQSKSQGKRAKTGVKRKADEMNFDAEDVTDVTNDTWALKKTAKKVKKTELNHYAYINPFIPEPSLTIAEHEAHSHTLSQAHHVKTLQ